MCKPRFDASGIKHRQDCGSFGDKGVWVSQQQHLAQSVNGSERAMVQQSRAAAVQRDRGRVGRYWVSPDRITWGGGCFARRRRL